MSDPSSSLVLAAPPAIDLAAMVAHAIPFGLAIAALAAGRLASSSAMAWKIAKLATATAALAAIGSVAAALLTPAAAGTESEPIWHLTSGLVLLLITAIGTVLTRFSATYLEGERNQQQFASWLVATLAGSTLVVATNHMLVLLAAWLATSLCLGNLLTFYGDRLMAQMAAHKKFLVSRAADICVLSAAMLLYAAFETFDIDALAAAARAADTMPTSASFGVVLLVIAVLLKSAQLPFHGWLMQVMEAPTPVSALLHAGVVNLGGYVLIRNGALVGAVPTAQATLVAVGGLTAALAVMTATTRVSIKVALAWSTCAQMGFMLLQCGLGLYGMALLHLLAHSIYKAHAFLTAGSTVDRNAATRHAPSIAAETLPRLLTGALGAAAPIAVALALDPSLLEQHALLAMMLVVVLAMGMRYGRRTTASAWQPALRAAASASLLTALWLALHTVFEHGFVTEIATTSPAIAAAAAAIFFALFAVDAIRRTSPQAPGVQQMQRWFQGGMFLDEWFTRGTLRLFRWQPNARSGHSARSTTSIREGEML
ncbi:MAG: NADH-quinone oxidoreductase subunit L [Planctomycetota bacterium]